ncbi:malate dehydrogenase (quinone) [Wolinella succinogenes]|uniref:Probable malate:quinone oxidoreductase n=2 Tax=Wolinella succinogenes TaxID=844 RepID=MQO_WOLSU|nr:malate dehydrogenase (quinone) [Wolinella succinogenes]Q7MBG6.1 RecName: Full=Probable malate:quinone oxidoreductase; AltName: Full=MQO; AltName: Full=Malate dehydrogenase [quinone] [Wolinella succinogenes DSM 1740]NLU33484.1 malate dehydrogenase (quinone) [Wolinella succinogenes]CAE09891.1 PUTATIVE MALATE:QUINONE OXIDOREDUCTASE OXIDOREDUCTASE PROTEIN) [Wolinella succinogenes]HCZ18063.1 malate dehydrogenase (quinone) [Helicobacter sp.]
MQERRVDVVLVGGGIMSATLGVLLKELEPSWSMMLLERLEGVALESTGAWNNAGTGHQALCELNYTPMRSNGEIDIQKAIKINESFEISKQFWAYHVQKKHLKEPESFIHPVPHMSFVRGKDVAYLQARHKALSLHPLFCGMKYSESMDEIERWVPLIAEGRKREERVAATCIDWGTDVNFGSLTEQFSDYLAKQEGFVLKTHHEVVDIKRSQEGHWRVKSLDKKSGEFTEVEARFVFIGAGGAALPLLYKSGIPEARGYGGFPVSGQWLVCSNPEPIEIHRAKVYGKAAVGAPPMSVPHLDTRVIDGEKKLLFGPFAGFSTNFLKQGSYLDFFLSFNSGNFKTMIEAGLDNIPLTQYLINQVMLSLKGRIEVLKEYMPKAEFGDWELKIAGQRVQIIKPDAKNRGSLQFGTEVVASNDGSLAALLGASPGASTAVEAMLGVLEKCFKKELETPLWKEKLQEMIPSYGHPLSDDLGRLNENRRYTSGLLHLPFTPVQ